MNVRIHMALISLFAGVMSFPVFAGDANLENKVALELSLDDLLNLNTKVASLLGGSRLDSPATVYLYNSTTIRQSTAQDLSEFLLRSVPGADVHTNTWNNPMWGFRGVLTDRSENILLNVNGEMQNLLGRDGVTGESVLGLMDDLDQIQVLTGPGSVIFGPGAIAGAINLELKDGRKETKDTSMTAEYGTHGDVTAQLAKVLRWDDGNRVLRFSAGYRRDVQKSGTYGGTPSEYPGRNINNPDHSFPGRDFDGAYRLTSVYTDQVNKFRIWGRYYDVVWYPGYGNSFPTPSATAQTYTNQGYFHRNLSVSADKTFTFSPETELKLTAGYSTAGNGIVVGFDHAKNNEVDPLKGDTVEALAESRYRLRADFTSRNVADLPFAMGTEVRMDNMGYSPLGKFRLSNWEAEQGKSVHQYPYTPVHYVNWATFGELQFSRWNFLRPVLGARVDKHTRGTTFAPRLALLSNSEDKVHHFRVVGQTAYRTPSADNYELNRFDGPTAQPRYELKPAKNQSVEVGYSYSAQPWNLGVVFHRNFLTLTTWNDALLATQNTNAATQGFEVEANYEKADWKLGLSHSYTGLYYAPSRPSFLSQDNKNLTNFVPHITRGTAQYRLNTWVFTGTGSYQWGFPGREAALAAKVADPVQGPAIQNGDWVTAKILKLDVNVEKNITGGRLGLQVKNLGGLWSKKNTLATNFDYMGPAGDGSLTNVVSQGWMEDKFWLRAYYTIEL